MSFEKYQQIEANADVCIRPGNSVTFQFSGEGNEAASRLFFTGETNISPYWKTEPDYQMLYRRIDDALRTDVAGKERFCLDFSGECCQYPKIAFKKLVAPFGTPMFVLNNYDEHWRLGISAKANNLKIDGYLRVTLEIRFQKEGIDRHSTVAEPDQVFTIDILPGTYEWKNYTKEIYIDAGKTANICYFVEGEDYQGEIYFEAPMLVNSNGHNLLGQFLPHALDRPLVNWMGQNLSHIEWVGMKIELNGTLIFDGEIFERCHRFSETEIRLPPNVIHSGENSLTFTCTSQYHDAAGYCFREYGFITETQSKVIAVPENIIVGMPFAICVEGKKGETFMFSSGLIRPMEELTLQTDGLNALHFICDTPANRVSFVLNEETFFIARCVERAKDGVLTGTGDLVYINANDRDFTNYLKWYLSENIGNLLTIRPTYRWSGTRTLDEELYKKMAGFLKEMGMFYVHMLDGRELPGCNANPLPETLMSEYFLGRQLHELDGQFCYWGYRDVTGKLTDQMFYDLFLRMDRKYAKNMHHRYVPENIYYTNEKQYIFRSPDEPHDMQKAAEAFVDHLQKTRKGNTRHTGPSTLFKYFYQAGFRWVGAELMYSPTELTIAALRGANAVYGGKIGAHLAVQWSTSPHDTEARYRRYRLALFICYMQGIDEINTEEGLWRLEEYYSYHHRFSDACRNHTAQQKAFYQYISTHSRTGKFYTPIAFLSGRYDGWRCFGGNRKNAWGIDGFDMEDVEAAWDLLTFFYPKSRLGALYRHPCPEEEIGYYSGTPYGNVDIIPIEAEEYSAYRLLVAPGYNQAETQDLQKMDNYVSGGGVLVLGWPQVAEDGEMSFAADTFCGHPVSVCEDITYDEVFLYTDSHRPLVTIHKRGKGTVYFVNAGEYARAKAVDLAYRQVLETVTASCLADEKVYARGDRNVQFSIYEQPDGGRNIYFIATDWHEQNPDGKGTVVIGDFIYEIDVPWGQLVKVAVNGGMAIYPRKDENEVIYFDGSIARVQGVGQAEFVVLKEGNAKSIVVDFTEQSVQEINISKNT